MTVIEDRPVAVGVTMQRCQDAHGGHWWRCAVRGKAEMISYSAADPCVRRAHGIAGRRIVPVFLRPAA